MKLDFLQLLIPAALQAAGLRLQLILSKKVGIWPGLILPGISFAMSLPALSGAVIYGGTWKDSLFTALSILIPRSIPAFILMAVCAACRSGNRRKRSGKDEHTGPVKSFPDLMR